MLTSRQRAYLRGIANGLDAVFQVGKGGVTENAVRQIVQYLEAREIVKIHLLRSDAEEPKAEADKIAAAADAEVVSVTGRKAVLYRKSSRLAEEGKSIALPEG